MEALNVGARFMSGTGLPIDGWRGISPIFTITANAKTIFLGTAFFISRNGLMLTAKHCLFKKGKAYQNLFIAQFLEDKKFLIRPISKSYWNNSDIAVMLPHIVRNKVTGKDILNPIPFLTIKKPTKGELIGSFAYPTTTILNDDKGEIIDVDETWHFGRIEDFHLNGTPILKNSCFQSSMHILGGSSGGPVTNSTGKIFAINSTGSDVLEGIQPYSFLTPIEHCLSIQIDGINGEKYTIRQLVELQQILCEM